MKFEPAAQAYAHAVDLGLWDPNSHVMQGASLVQFCTVLKRQFH